MFHQSNWIILFYIIFLAAFIVTGVRADITDISAQTNTQYTQRLTAASHGAMEAVETSGATTGGTNIWATEAQRGRSVDAFYTSLGNSFLTNTDNNMMQVSVPIMLLIDTDGFYVNYNATLDVRNILDPNVLPNFKSTSQMSPITTWSMSKYGYRIRHYLGDKIQVTDNTGAKYEGTYASVVNSMVKNGVNSNSNIVKYINGTERDPADTTKSMIEYEKNALISNTIQDTLSFYVNRYNYAAGENGGGYTFNLPVVKGEDWHRLIENPTFLAFMQGHNTNNGETVINTYAYTGSELIPTERYFVAKNNVNNRLEYHSLRQALKNGEVTYHGDKYEFNGEKIGKFYNSMAECTKVRANPCIDCIR